MGQGTVATQTDSDQRDQRHRGVRRETPLLASCRGSGFELLEYFLSPAQGMLHICANVLVSNHVLKLRLMNEGTACCSRLLRYGPAGDPVSGISRWVGLHVVRLGVNHDCGPAVAEQRMAVVAEIHILVLNGELGRSAFRDGEIRHVAGVVTFRILQSMLFVIRVKVWPGRLEVRHVTFRVLVNMDSMFPGRKISKIQPDLHALFCRYQLCCSDALAIRILQMDNFFVSLGRAE